MNPVSYTIGQLAKAVELPTSTIRYYERRGLLRPRERSEGNYRLFDDSTIERVRFIRSAQLTGFKLDDIQMLLSFEGGASCPCGQVKEVLAKRLHDIDTQMSELRKLRRSLRESIAICEQSDPDEECGVIANMAVTPSDNYVSGRKNCS